MLVDDTSKIRALNDHTRRTLSGCRVVVTPGVRALGDSSVAAILAAVRQFDAFTPACDPFGEHDFGSFTHEGHTVFWKIDYYDLDLSMHSPNPADPTVTARMLTIMLAEEY